MSNTIKQAEQLAIDIVKYLDEINHHTFTDEEKIEGYSSIINNINNNCNDTLDYLEEEYSNTNDNECLELINRLKKIMEG